MSKDKKKKAISKCSSVSFMSIWAEKQVFFLLQKLAYFTTKNDANKLKRYVFSKTAIESAKKQWRQANTVFSVKFGQTKP